MRYIDFFSVVKIENIENFIKNQGGSNKYPQSMFLEQKYEKYVYPCIPQFYYIKVGFKGVIIAPTCFPDDPGTLYTHNMDFAGRRTSIY